MHERQVSCKVGSVNRADSDVRIIEYINSHEGVEWMPMCDVAKEFLEGRIPGVEVHGGADV